jgi:TetR/AcrR family tetracycline transcriptional repressor
MDDLHKQATRRAKTLERLEAMQRKAHERLEKKRERIDKRIDHLRNRLLQQAEEPSDQQQRIIKAALELLDEEGLNNLSLRKLAAKLNIQAPALYWHFKSKEVLIDYMAESILQTEFKDITPRVHDEPWQEWLITLCKRLRKAMKAHRDGSRVVAGAHLYPAVTLIQIFEVAMESLTSSGIELQKANLMITTAIHFVFGNAIEEQSAPSIEELKNFINGEPMSDFPLVAKSVKKSQQDALRGYDEFEDALRLIIGHSGNERT